MFGKKSGVSENQKATMLQPSGVWIYG